jgi:uncharacterized RDD family membrane protein YckC
METVLDQVCTSCGSTRLPYGRYCLFCGDLLSESTGKAAAPSEAANSLDKAGSSSPAAIEYGGFWRRFWAGTIDVALEATGALVVTFAIDFVLARVGGMLGYERSISKVAAGMAYILVLSVGSWLYCAFAESSPRRATIGKRIMGLQVVTANGGQVSFGQATIRHLMKFLSLFSAGFGFIMAVWTKRRQALHDMPSDCIVIRVPREKAFSLLSH